ncbi:MAG: protein-glutamate O-methyltransferase CheR [Pirellulales bacterium]|nr:protein-glutamate O-methyltransferase CheR [Pirellulales bacterium]
MAVSLPTEQVSDTQLARYADLIYVRTGIRISSQKKTLLSNRLRRRLRATGITGYDAYLKKIKSLSKDDPEWTAFLQEITTHESYLFRDITQWDWFRDTYLSEISSQARAGERKKSLRIWSAACSTGDEPYTIACCVLDRLVDVSQWQVDIFGTDIGMGALEHANEGVYSKRAMQGVPETYKRRFFSAVNGTDTWKVKPVLQKHVRFKHHNLLQPLKELPFDLIFVKNVLIYFDTDSKTKVLHHVVNQLSPGGMLVTGPAEGTSDLLKHLDRMQGWLHQKQESSSARGKSR